MVNRGGSAQGSPRWAWGRAPARMRVGAVEGRTVGMGGERQYIGCCPAWESGRPRLEAGAGGRRPLARRGGALTSPLLEVLGIHQDHAIWRKDSELSRPSQCDRSNPSAPNTKPRPSPNPKQQSVRKQHERNGDASAGGRHPPLAPPPQAGPSDPAGARAVYWPLPLFICYNHPVRSPVLGCHREFRRCGL